jgi:hypothetical protein
VVLWSQLLSSLPATLLCLSFRHSLHTLLIRKAFAHKGFGDLLESRRRSRRRPRGAAAVAWQSITGTSRYESGSEGLPGFICHDWIA